MEDPEEAVAAAAGDEADTNLILLRYALCGVNIDRW